MWENESVHRGGVDLGAVTVDGRAFENPFGVGDFLALRTAPGLAGAAFECILTRAAAAALEAIAFALTLPARLLLICLDLSLHRRRRELRISSKREEDLTFLSFSGGSKRLNLTLEL